MLPRARRMDSVRGLQYIIESTIGLGWLLVRGDRESRSSAHGGRGSDADRATGRASSLTPSNSVGLDGLSNLAGRRRTFDSPSQGDFGPATDLS